MQGIRTWLNELSRRGWAWEFLRRNPDYSADYYSVGSAHAATKWGLLHFADPSINAIDADVFWRPDISDEVLPMAIATDYSLSSHVTLNLEGLSCRIVTASEVEAQRRDLLFSEEGRYLQLAIFGDGDFRTSNLVVPALDDPKAVMARTASLRRLNDLLFNKTMRKGLYPPEGRAARLANVLTALDGWLGQRSQRDIAVRIFGEKRVEQLWSDPRGHMRDQVRRAIYHGRELMSGGYRQFLQLTFARRIAAGRDSPRAK